MIGPDDSLIDDEFHKAAKRILARPVGARIKGIYEPPPKPKPPQVSTSLTKNFASGRLKISQEKKCRICPSKQNLTRHHLVPQSWFIGRPDEIKAIRNANANIVPLCESCHRIVDSVRDPVGKLKKRAILREALGTNEFAFIIQLTSRQWLDEHYPKEP